CRAWRACFRASAWHARRGKRDACQYRSAAQTSHTRLHGGGQMMVTPGITVFLREQPDLVAGQRVGLVASAASIDENLTGSADLRHAHPDVQLVALFGPEHGLRGSAQAGDHVSTYTDPRTGLPVYSLYGETQRPTAAMLEGIDTLIYDLQD